MDDSPHGAVRLNDNQRRHYEVLFSRLEQSLEQIERATRGEPLPSLLTVPIDDLPKPFLSDSAALIESARQLLGDIVVSLGLQPRRLSRTRTCQALVTSEMIGLENGYAAHLRGYGPVDPSLAEELDPALKRLHAHFGLLGSLLRDTGQSA